MLFGACGVGTSFLNVHFFRAQPVIPSAKLTLEALFTAYFDCRRHKRNTLNQLKFEADLEPNLMQLWRELNDGSYVIGRSIAFVVMKPKIREVWAADFRDRVVHHLIYNAVRERFHHRFIRDSYACIPGRGIHDGCRRVSGFARSITRNWTRPAYVLKIDVANFFNSIDRTILLPLIERRVQEEWLLRLIRQVTLHDPRPTAVLQSPRSLFEQVPAHKSLLRARHHIGLPIGNLTSQFFANVYMNELDQFAKHVLKAHYYGRYVDDIVMFHTDSAVLNQWLVQIDAFLHTKLNLGIHPNKVWLNLADKGVDFIGFIIKPGRVYVRHSTLNACQQRVCRWERQGSPLDTESLGKLASSLNSYMGMLRQVNGYNSRRVLCERVENLFLQADRECTRFWSC